MNVYVFQAALLCEKCGKHVIDDLIAEGIEDIQDSGEFPQGPYADGGGEADSPQHCDHCGEFLENDLTSAGYAYVREMAADKSSADGVIRQWMEFYDLT